MGQGEKEEPCAAHGPEVRNRRTRQAKAREPVWAPPPRRASPMRPAPSLHYVSTLLDHRRRRYHRARLRWGTGLTLLGLGLLLGGWWGAFRLLPRATPRAAVISPAGLPAHPAGPPGMRRIAVAPRWGGPGLLEPEVCQDCAGQTRSPWHPACTPGDVVALGGPTRPGCTPDLAQRPWELALPARGPLPVQTGGALAAPPPSGLSARGAPPPAPLSSPACAAAPCPAVHAAGRPASSRAQQPQRPGPRRRAAGSRRPAQPVPPQRRVSDYAISFLAEPERLMATP